MNQQRPYSTCATLCPHAPPRYNDTEGAGHSPLIGYAADGFGLYGKYDATGQVPEDLDRCNGHFEADLGYHYHTSTRFPCQWAGVGLSERAG